MNNKSNINQLSIPNSFGNMTINELMSRPDVEVEKRGNTLRLRQRLDGGVATFTYQEYSTEGHRSDGMSFTPTPKRKKDLAPDVLEMKRRGIPQKDIAYELGISPSLVSNIVNEK